MMRDIETCSLLSLQQTGREREQRECWFPCLSSLRECVCLLVRIWKLDWANITLDARSPVWRKTLIRKIDNFDWFWLGPRPSRVRVWLWAELTRTEWAGQSRAWHRDWRSDCFQLRAFMKCLKFDWSIVWANLLHPVIFKLTSNLMIIITP